MSVPCQRAEHTIASRRQTETEISESLNRPDFGTCRFRRPKQSTLKCFLKPYVSQRERYLHYRDARHACLWKVLSCSLMTTCYLKETQARFKYNRGSRVCRIYRIFVPFPHRSTDIASVWGFGFKKPETSSILRRSFRIWGRGSLKRKSILFTT